MKVAVFGCGYVGLTSGVCLAVKGHEVTAVDIDPSVVAALEAGKPHIHEPGLAELLAEVLRVGRLKVTTDLPTALDDAEIAMLAVGTPSRAGAIDLGAIRKLARDIGAWLKTRNHFLAVVVKSTVVPGITDTVIRGEIEATSGKRLGEFGLAMNPEFLREGKAVADFLAPDRIVLGHDDPKSLALLEQLYAPWDCDKLRVNSRTAELIKYASNALLAVQISAANEIANLATALGGIDAMEVMKGVQLDRRWSPISKGSRLSPGILGYLLPGPGFGGSCLPKDLEALAAAGHALGQPMRMAEAVLGVNRAQPRQVIAKLEDAIGSLAGAPVLVLGLAFKPGTDDVRDSASSRIVEILLDKGAQVTAHDPMARDSFRRALGARSAQVTLAANWQAAVAEAGIIVVATNWPEYRALAGLDLAGKTLFDTRRMFVPDELACGLYLGVGRAVGPAAASRSGLAPERGAEKPGNSHARSAPAVLTRPESRRMRVLITGHCGYIGPVMTRLFHAAGHEIVGFDTGYFRDLVEDAPQACQPDAEMKGDIRDIDEAAFQGMDAVVHLAALSNDPIGDIVAAKTEAINAGGSLRAGEMAKKAGVRRFVLASSCSLYGKADTAGAPLDEDAPFAPVSAYARSKVAAEAALHALADRDFEPIILRNGTAFGASPRMRLDLVLGNLMAYGYATGVIRVLSDGTAWRPLVHIEDISRAALAAVEAPVGSLAHRVFNIGRRDCNYTVREIAEIAARFLPGCRIEITGETGNDPRSYRVDFTRALTKLKGFDPQWTLERGAAETYAWLKSHEPAIERLLGEKYIRLKRIQALRRGHRIDEDFRWTQA